ncbi:MULTISPECIES: alkyl hydroperoxide reductase subunit F [Thermoactinomyces]|jgi:NADH-dependent peroxiredoxin subunit F|uniref:Alkyl hydroperoxide reductase subunit F n=1 Tax=Thermoactinomyces vulgaris TaxID=2026 RepID=A0ABS0QGI5_THEVU|nr:MULTISPECIES: alkyl hydroperoxide reductase subunit F [Thermoactinomyces]KFZ41527.1 NADH dehydrogenase [Thermoactinomyces sp. Gus2-1]KYQ86400.1 alkyl hydroperoxide reductase subunit F [Thermoactinomyces sp. AS95]MBA4551887.1 alkyl hydroperoxide reductase subunit F [Thermoactinomyces vulgaris]MBA4597218.1 alkyl hydroperoxide reductase subunit F [Thermoactinomyces vulgaris]MBH8583368.1 alkyl hydroperoxide reductase subunit F [Thermoactinomyces sp. CICC 10735]
MLDAEIKTQLEQYLQLLENDIVLKVSAGSDKVSQDMLAFVDEVAGMSPKIKVEKTTLERTPSFSVDRVGEDSGIVFAGIPLGHEFSSFVLALLQVSGRPPKVEQSIIDQIKNLDGEYHFETYVSLSCTNCPDVVQALNMMSVLNPGIKHTMIEGKAYQEEVESKDILAVPTVYLNGEFFESGRMTIGDILKKLGSESDPSEFNKKDPFDVLVIGGGPAGATAAIYAARKGVRTGIIADRFGGQILDTTTIENFISVKQTDGEKLASQLEAHVRDYPVDVMDSQTVKRIEKKDDMIDIFLENGAVLKSKTVIIATGARWRNVGVPGEDKFRNKGVANCTHCDAPLFAGKDVAVIGGGNSGIESAIDLAGIANHVTVLEFMPELKADEVLQKRLNSLPNVTVITNAQTKEITGTDKVDGIKYIDRETGEEHHIKLQGVFVQIGLVPNTEWLEGTVEMDRGQIIVDSKGATNVPGIFAAGDCTNSAYKQIIISMGSGATAALGAFDYLIRN